MDIQKKQNSSKTLTTTLTLLLFLLLSFFVVGSDTIVLAQEESYVDEGVDIKDLVFGTNTQLERGSRRPKLVHIKKGDYVYSVFTLETNIYKILDQFQIPLDGEERVIVSTDYVKNGSLVRVIKTKSVIEDIQVEIPFESEVIKTDKYLKGEIYTTQEGVLGVRTQKVLNYYEDGVLVERKILVDRVVKSPVKEVLEEGTSLYSLAGIDPKGYNCDYWYHVVDTGPYTPEEQRWLKFIMYCESGCNAESNKGSYKGLFQWSPFWWSKQFSENIFDGHAQIRNTVAKYRAGEKTRVSQWPACHAKYVSTYGVN
jgi:hypothetical protein